MKKVNYFLLIAAFSLIAVSCNKDNGSTQTGSPAEPASMTITLKGSNMGTKAIGTSTQSDENTINNFTVYVYNGNSNILEKSQTFNPSILPGDYTQTILGLTSGPKKVVIIANTPAGYTVVAGSTYGDLANTMFDLSTQISATNLAMSGESTTILTASPLSNAISIPLSRIVAKVRLGGVTLTPDAGHTGTFTLDSVYIMRARATATIGAPTVITGTGFYGGINGDESTAQTFLAEVRNINVVQDSTRYFYVFPNDNTGNTATLITLVGTYEGQKMYYPFRVNDASNTGTADDNKYIKRNQHHTINVTMKRPGSGVSNPETPVDPATLDITISAEDWIIMPHQDVSW